MIVWILLEERSLEGDTHEVPVKAFRDRDALVHYVLATYNKVRFSEEKGRTYWQEYSGETGKAGFVLAMEVE